VELALCLLMCASLLNHGLGVTCICNLPLVRSRATQPTNCEKQIKSGFEDSRSK
jgi:hypothetical protein